MVTSEESKYDAHLEARESNKPACHKCGKQKPQVDLVECTNLRCDRHVCCECASEVEFEMEACSDHAWSVYVDMRNMYRDALRRATQQRRAA